MWEKEKYKKTRVFMSNAMSTHMYISLQALNLSMSNRTFVYLKARWHWIDVWGGNLF